MTVLHKARQGLLALPVDQLLQPALRQSRHNHPDSYQIIACKKDVYKHSYLPKTVIDWNKLPHSIIKIKDSPSFNHLKLHAHTQPYTSGSNLGALCSIPNRYRYNPYSGNFAWRASSPT